MSFRRVLVVELTALLGTVQSPDMVAFILHVFGPYVPLIVAAYKPESCTILKHLLEIPLHVLGIQEQTLWSSTGDNPGTPSRLQVQIIAFIRYFSQLVVPQTEHITADPKLHRFLTLTDGYGSLPL